MAKITGVLLAAGASQRYGANKLTEPFEDEELVLHSVRALEPCDRIIAVVRKGANELQALLQDNGVETVVNGEPWRGMGSSIACGVNASRDSGGWCILPADMPKVAPATTALVVSALRSGAELAAPYYLNQRGHPVGFSKVFAPQLVALASDVGARHILEQHQNKVRRVHIDDAGVLQDVDTELDLAMLEPEHA